MIEENIRNNPKDDFDTWYKIAKDYYNEHGNLLVPHDYKDKDGKQLGKWLSSIRIKYHSKTLRISRQKVDKLNQIGMIWNVLDYKWNAKYEEVKKFYAEYHDLNLLPLYKGEEGQKLLSWIKSQRSIYYSNKEGLKYTEKITKLEQVGIVCKHNDELWNDMYTLAVNYHDKYHHLLIPVYYETEDNKKLGVWIRNQRKSYVKGDLSLERINALEAIGMTWKVNETKWNLMYEELKNYYDKYHTLTISKTYEPMFVTNEELKTWLNVQRKNYRRETILTSSQRQKLEYLGIERDNAKEYWFSMYNLAFNYYQKNQHLTITHPKTSEEKSLYTWLRNQRYSYRQGKLSMERIELLNALNFIWSPRKNLTAIYIYIAKNNLDIDMQLNRDILNRTSLLEFKAKTNYLINEKHLPLVDASNHLHEIFTMSSLDIQNNPKYNLTLEEIINLYEKRIHEENPNKRVLKP